MFTRKSTLKFEVVIHKEPHEEYFSQICYQLMCVMCSYSNVNLGPTLFLSWSTDNWFLQLELCSSQNKSKTECYMVLNFEKSWNNQIKRDFFLKKFQMKVWKHILNIFRTFRLNSIKYSSKSKFDLIIFMSQIFRYFIKK